MSVTSIWLAIASAFILGLLIGGWATSRWQAAQRTMNAILAEAAEFEAADARRREQHTGGDL